ncbi:MAG: hypothetical protein HKN82_18900 [Akkermansiaceae bacterium]|nr:hypothetical protein [Akkermansiaceae bacterium]
MSVSPLASQRSGLPGAEARPGLSAAGCPRCATTLEEAPEACPHCGFSLPSCARNFAFDPPPLEFLMDPEGRLAAGSGPVLTARRNALRTIVPQVDFSFCLVSLAAGHDVRDFSFWLFNSAPDLDASRAWQILVTADFTAGRIVLTPGYAVEPFLQHDPWNHALALLAERGGNDDWAGGIAAFLDRARGLLSIAAARAAAADPPGSPRPGPDPESSGPAAPEPKPAAS